MDITDHGRKRLSMNSKSPDGAPQHVPEIARSESARKRFLYFVTWPVVLLGLALLFAPSAYSRFAMSVVTLGSTLNQFACTFLFFRHREFLSFSERVICRTRSPASFYCYGAVHVLLSVILLAILVFIAAKPVSVSLG